MRGSRLSITPFRHFYSLPFAFRWFNLFPPSTDVLLVLNSLGPVCELPAEKEEEKAGKGLGGKTLGARRRGGEGGEDEDEDEKD
jgi:hypothetical protein